jgi:hypothetical protein
MSATSGMHWPLVKKLLKSRVGRVSDSQSVHELMSPVIVHAPVLHEEWQNLVGSHALDETF